MGRWLQEAMALVPFLLLLLQVSVSTASMLTGVGVGVGVPSRTHAASRPPLMPPPIGTSCEQARQKCVYRTGCGRALQRYGFACLGLEGDHCPDACRDALVILTSTPEGQELMTCTCTDEACEDSKRRVEACRPAVAAAARNESVYTCDLAQWVCAADPTCGTALDYYNRLCRRMFAGQKCTRKCKNSISILRRQKKAAKLDTCLCDGREDSDFDCGAIRENMAHLCFHQKIPVVGPGAGAGRGKEKNLSGAESGSPITGDVETNELIPRGYSRGAAAQSAQAPQRVIAMVSLIAVSLLRINR